MGNTLNWRIVAQSNSPFEMWARDVGAAELL